jgi:hypothetical protein
VTGRIWLAVRPLGRIKAPRYNREKRINSIIAYSQFDEKRKISYNLAIV